MAELAMGSESVDVEHVVLTGEDGTRIDMVHARTDGMPWAGLVIHPDLMGLRPVFEDMSRRFASHGLAVVALEPFARMPVEIATSPDMANRRDYLGTMDDELSLSDFERAADYLVVHDDVRKVAFLGFCAGGTQAFKAAATGRFDRAVACYGVIHGFEGPRRRDVLESAADGCPTLAIFGGRDGYVPLEHVDELRVLWKDRSDSEVVVYPEAEHAFIHVPEAPAHRPADAADAWSRILSFLEPLRR